MPSLTVSVAGNQDATEDQSSLRLLVRNRYKLSIRLKSSRSRELTRAYCATPCSRDDFHAHQEPDDEETSSRLSSFTAGSGRNRLGR